jgi:hypothetical protein
MIKVKMPIKEIKKQLNDQTINLKLIQEQNEEEKKTEETIDTNVQHQVITKTQLSQMFEL